MKSTKWTSLVVFDEEGVVGTLGVLVEERDGSLPHATVDTERGGISEWEGFMMAAPGEDPGWDTPVAPVDWEGFPGCIYCGRVVSGTDVPSDDAEWAEAANDHADDCEWIATRAHTLQIA